MPDTLPTDRVSGLAGGIHPWSYLDITAIGRQEEWEDSPAGYPQTPPYEWWNWHDEYGDTQPAQRWSAQVKRRIQAGQARRRP